MRRMTRSLELSICCSFVLVLLSVGGKLAVAEDSATSVRFKRIVLDDKFRSEGVAVADVNKDGKNDIVVGDLWYEAPSWKPHEIRKPRVPNRGGYTDAFAVYDGDFNGDGWVDVLVIQFHGKDALWYENPQNKPGHWTARVAFKGTGNETRIYPDLFGDGKKVFVMGVEGRIAWVSVPKDATGPWDVHFIGAGKEGAHRFYHGLGTGDVNGDGRNDVMIGEGWFEQPAEGRKAAGPWKFHKTRISPGCADMYVMDADGDGRNDILSSSAHGVGIWWNRQSGDAANPTFKAVTLDKSIKETHSLNFVDVNGDGRKDLVTGWRFFAHGFRPDKADMPSELAWFEIHTAKGQPPRLVKHSIDKQSGVGAQFVTRDYNGDGLLDIIISNRKGVFVFKQIAAGK